jgi:hypothetical protein
MSGFVSSSESKYTVRNAHGNIGRSGEFPMNNCEVSFKEQEKDL